MSYFGLNPRVRQSGLGVAQHGRISKHGRSHARGLLVEAAWAASKASGPLRAFFLRIRAKRGHQVAAVATARKLTVLIWHMLTKQQDYLWVRPALVAAKERQLALKAGAKPERGVGRRGSAYAYNVKELRDLEEPMPSRPSGPTIIWSGTGCPKAQRNHRQSGIEDPPKRSGNGGTCEFQSSLDRWEMALFTPERKKPCDA